MMETVQEPATLRPAGYAALIERYGLDVIPNWHKSLVTTSGIHRIDSIGGVVEEVYPAKYWPGDELGDQLEFALKYDGTNLAILASLFPAVAPEEFLAYVQSKPTGKYARRLWFLYEFLTGTRLALDDVEQGHYIDLLDPDQYYTVAPARPVRRQRINDNLLGDGRFCPTIRRTDALRGFEQADLAQAVPGGRIPLLAGIAEAGNELSLHQGDEIVLRDRTHQAQSNADRAFHCPAPDGGERRLLREKRG